MTGMKYIHQTVGHNENCNENFISWVAELISKRSYVLTEKKHLLSTVYAILMRLRISILQVKKLMKLCLFVFGIQQKPVYQKNAVNGFEIRPIVTSKDAGNLIASF